MKTIAWVLLLLVSASCNSHEPDDIRTKRCPPYSIVPASPYDDPIWHPSGQIIGFNHMPIKEINYSNGYDCVLQAIYTYDEQQNGFWLVNADGTGKRRVLPFNLHTPDWSPDGRWVAFMQGAQLFKMPFDGSHFDTAAIERITVSGRNFFPAWSPDGKRIAYDNTDCGSQATPKPKNSCGILIRGETGGNSDLVASGRMPEWLTDDTMITVGLQSQIYRFSLADSSYTRLTSTNRDNYYPKYSPHERKIAFISRTRVGPGGSQVWIMDCNGRHLRQLTDLGATTFSWSPEGKIVFVNFNHGRIDADKGTLWVMDADGGNKKQLTFNEFKITQ